MHALLFDLYGLFIPEQSRTSFETLARTVGVAPDALFPAYRGENRAEYDAGRIGSREYWAKVGVDTGVDIDWQAALAADLASLERQDDEMVDYARSLNRAGLTMGMLSNIPCDFIGWTRWHQPWIDELFDPVLFSCRLRLAKPDEEIFEVALARLSAAAGEELAPADVLFVDDSEPNVDTAKKMGFRTWRFSGLEGLRKEIETIYDLG